jgi:hypothetical protein
VGLDVTIYNPRLDPGRTAGRGLIRAIANALRPWQGDAPNSQRYQ